MTFAPSLQASRPRQLAGDALAVVGLLLLGLLVYAPCLRGAFLWDDPAHVTRAGLQSLHGLWRIWFEAGATQEYYPVLHSAFWFEHRLWGDAAMPYHVTNVLLHVANAAVFALLLRRLWAPAGGPRTVPAGAEWLAAALFVVHPVAVESVAWITEQKNTLSTFFYLLSAWYHLDFSARRKRGSYLLALGLFLIALGAKTATVTLPAALLVVLWWKQGRLAGRRDVLPLLPWFVVAVVAGLVTSQVESHWVGAELVVPDLSIIERVLLAARIFWFYLGKLLWPVGITFFYPLWNVAAESSGWIGALAGGLLVTVGLWFYRGRSRGPLAAWLLYGGTLFPVLGFFKVFAFSFSYVADHLQYLAMPFVLAALIAGIFHGVARIPGLPRLVGPLLCAVLILGLAFLARSHSRLYLDDETLFRANIAANPRSWMGHRVLAHAVGESPQRRDEAIALYRTAIRLNPGNPDPAAALAALLVERPGHRDEAIALFQEALRLRPTFAEAHNGLANELAAIPGRETEAIEHYEAALRLRPRFGLARANLAQLLARMPGRQDEALACFEEVIREMPDYAPAQFQLGNLLATLPGRQADAVPHFEAALQLRPDVAEIHAGLANVLAQLGRLPEALAHFDRALQLDPAADGIHYDLARRLAGMPDRLGDALAHTEEAVRLNPNFVEAYNLLGVLNVRLGRIEAGRAAWQRALGLRPDFAPAQRNLRILEQNAGQ